MKNALHLHLLLLTLFFGSCTTQRIAQLNPNVPEKFQDRDGFVTQKGDSLDVTFGYLYSTRDHLVFEVSVKNNSSDSVLVEPKKFSYETMALSDTTMPPALFAAQSFSQLTQKLNERVREAHLKAAALVLVTVVAVVAVDAAANKHRPARYREYSYAVRTGVNLSFNYFDAVIYNQLSKREARKGLESSFMFARKIGPNQSHIGAVYFPRYDKATELLFNFKTGGQDFKTLFRQTMKARY